MNALSLPDSLKKSLLTMSVIDHFERLDTTLWTAIEGDAAADVTHDADGVNGVANLAVTTTDNEEAYLHTPELFKIAQNKPIYAVTRLQYAEGNTDDANVLFGFVNAVAANLIPDGGGVKTTFTGAVIYKKDGETRWRLAANNGGTTVEKILDYTAGGAGYQTLAILIDPYSAGNFRVSAWIDTAGGNALQQAREYNVSPRVPLVQLDLTYSSPTEMALAFGLKNGGTNSESLNIDLAAFAQQL